MAIKGNKGEFALACCESKENEQTYEKGIRITEDLKRENPDINMILFIPSVLPMSPFDKAIKGIESVFSSTMPIFGGASVDNMKGINVYAFFDGEVVENGWIAIGFSDPTLKVITQVNHGFNVLTGMHLENFTGSEARMDSTHSLHLSACFIGTMSEITEIGSVAGPVK